MAAWLTNTPMNGHGPWMLMMQDCSKRIQKICYLPHPDHHWSPVNGSLWRFFFFSNPCYHPLRHGMHRRDRNLGIFLITQVITICCWIDSLRGPNIPQWNRQENSACYIYIFDDWHHIGLGYHHWNSSTLSSHGMLIGKCLEHVDRDFARAWWQRITEIISITWKYKCSFITKSFA